MDTGEDLDHIPIVLELVGARSKPTKPFKFNSLWLNDENFVKSLKSIRVMFVRTSRDFSQIQFVKTLKLIKGISIKCSIEMREK